MSEAAAGASGARGLFRCGFRSFTPAGVLRSAVVFVSLLAADQILQAVFALLILRWKHGDPHQLRDMVKAGLMSLLPVGLLIAALASALSRWGGGAPRETLSLRPIGLGFWRTALIVAGFIAGLYLWVMVVVTVLGIDVSQYTPGPHGESPVTGSAGAVKEAMFDLANNPRLFLLILPSVAIGAPLAEEFIFRGQIFTALAGTRLGFSGATVITAAAWALMHYSEPWLSIGLIFVMGLVLGYLLYRFGSLRLTMLCHGAWNLVYSLFIFGAVGS